MRVLLTRPLHDWGVNSPAGRISTEGGPMRRRRRELHFPGHEADKAI